MNDEAFDLFTNAIDILRKITQQTCCECMDNGCSGCIFRQAQILADKMEAIL